MRTLYMSPFSPYTRKVRVMLAEKGLEYKNLIRSPSEVG